MPTQSQSTSNDLEDQQVGLPLTTGRVRTIARRQWWVVVVTAIAAAVGAGAYVELRAPAYAATIALYTAVPGGQAQSPATTVNFPDPMLDAGAGAAVHAAAAGANLTASQVTVRATAEPVQSQLLLKVTAPGRGQAARAVQAAAGAFRTAWSRRLTSLANATSPQLAALRQQLKVLYAQGNSTGVTSGAGSQATQPSSPLATEIQVVTTAYSTLYNEQLQYRLAAGAVLSAKPGQVAVASANEPKSTVLLLVLGCGALVGCGLALLRDLTQDRLSEPAELSQLADLPMLGELPVLRRGRELLFLDYSADPFGEAVRMLRATLSSAKAYRPPRTLLVASAAGGEGRSLVAANLAVGYALSGARTVIVSSDLRNPRLEAIMGLAPPSAGLAQAVGADAVSQNGSALPGGTDGHTEAVLTGTSIQNLVLLPSGPVSRNPVELLGSPGMQDLVAHLREQFDIVIFDSPPVLAVADALVLSSYADCVLFVLDRTRSKKRQMRRALLMFERVRANICGLVLNRAASSALGSYRYPTAPPDKVRDISSAPRPVAR